MHVRVSSYPAKTITFTRPHGVVVTMPIETEADSDGWEFDLPALASISVVGEISSVGPAPEEPTCNVINPRQAATCTDPDQHPGDHHDAFGHTWPRRADDKPLFTRGRQ